MFKFAKYVVILLEVCFTIFVAFMCTYYYLYNPEPILYLLMLAILANIAGIVFLLKKDNVFILTLLITVLLYFVIMDVGLNLERISSNTEGLLLYLGIIVSYFCLGYIALSKYKAKNIEGVLE